MRALLAVLTNGMLYIQVKQKQYKNKSVYTRASQTMGGKLKIEGFETCAEVKTFFFILVFNSKSEGLGTCAEVKTFFF